MSCKTRQYLTTTDQQVHITDEREWVVVLFLQLVLDSIQQFGTKNQHAVLVEVVLVQTVYGVVEMLTSNGAVLLFTI